jgi:hypothetical protein
MDSPTFMDRWIITLRIARVTGSPAADDPQHGVHSPYVPSPIDLGDAT